MDESSFLVYVENTNNEIKRENLVGDACIVLHVENSLAIKRHFLDFIQGTKYQVFIFSLFDNDINSITSWSNTMQSKDRTEDMKVFKREENKEMNTSVHGNGPELEEGTVFLC